MLKVKGFSLVEVLVVITIMGIILAIVMYSFSAARSKKQVEIAIDSINFKLEQAKANAIAGKNGNNFGVQFSTTTYVYFSGNSYNPADITNSSSTIEANLQITKNFSDGGSVIIFSRLTGFPQATGTITVTNTSNASSTARITIGTLGDINMIK
ncbi:MAG: prepilin-type N-terminal cleavage/methylation domain-containing protein [Candidatus Taylorbacteria bacterium]|nr:prepilin-type N-terminal cleavage/methylation domain-containing protein [Candidatus Taylorbacteria bacterium]